MRRCWGAGMWEVSGMWDVGCEMLEVTFARERLRWVALTVGRVHFGKAAADINLVGMPLDP